MVFELEVPDWLDPVLFRQTNGPPESPWQESRFPSPAQNIFLIEEELILPA